MRSIVTDYRGRQVRRTFIGLIAAFLMGLTGELYLQMPGMGVMPMLDIASYVVAPVLMVMYWGRMGRKIRTSILFGWAWSLIAFPTGLIYGYDMHTILKEFAVCGSSWALMTVAWFVLRGDARRYLTYLIGYGVGAYIGLYYFKQGTWLAIEYQMAGDFVDVCMDKQKFPIIANCIYYGGVLTLFLLFKKVPVFLVIAGCFFSGFYLLLHGGSRSNFGFYAAAGLLGISVCYGGRMARMLMKSRVRLAILGVVGIGLVFGTYKFMAQSGALGESERRKYLDQFEDESAEKQGLNERADFDVGFHDVFVYPLGRGADYGKHSSVTSAMCREGLVGMAFWIFFFVQISWFVSRRLMYTGHFSTFFSSMVMLICWNALGSPFGSRHTYFVMMAFIAICQDAPLYGEHDVFSFSKNYYMQYFRRRLVR